MWLLTDSYQLEVKREENFSCLLLIESQVKYVATQANIFCGIRNDFLGTSHLNPGTL
jgi:hypothetical protein